MFTVLTSSTIKRSAGNSTNFLHVFFSFFLFFLNVKTLEGTISTYTAFPRDRVAGCRVCPAVVDVVGALDKVCTTCECLWCADREAWDG